MTQERKKVYYTQIPVKRVNGQLLPVYDVQDSTIFGDAIVLFKHYCTTLNTPDIFAEIRKKLKDFTRGDFLVMSGDPGIYAYACAYLGREIGHFYILKWDKMYQTYNKVPITTF